MRCASYARYMSCIPQKEIPSDIIRQQNERIQKYIKLNKWELVEKYADRKQDMEADDAFREMQKDGVNRKFDMIVVDSLFRCGANVSYAEDVLLKSFYPAGIHFAVVEDDVCSMNLTPDEVAAYQITGSSNNMYRQYLNNPKGFAFFRKYCMENPVSNYRLILDCIHYCSSSVIAKNKSYIRESPKKLLTLICTIPGILLTLYIRYKVKKIKHKWDVQ